MSKKLLVFTLLFVSVLILSIFVSASAELGTPKLDMNCYQIKCKAEKDLWDKVNSRCIFTPKEISDYKENNKNKLDKLEVFLNKKEISPQSYDLIMGYMEGDPVPYHLISSPEANRILLEFQCQVAGLTFGSEDCDESFADNYLVMIDDDLLKSDLSWDAKDKIQHIYSNCIWGSGNTIPISVQIFNFIAYCVLLLFFPFFVALFIILGYWVLHRKEEGSFSYVKEGIYGFLISIAHIAISMVIAFFFADELLFPIPNVFFLFGLIAVTPILGLIMEFKLYKKTGKMRWKYALIFSIILIISAIIILYQDITHPKLV